MNTKLNKIEVNPEYANLFSFDDRKDKIEHKAQMISYRILSEVERVCDAKKIKKKDLAARVGTSKSYITQLFRGAKQVNTQILARFEEALAISFEIHVKFDEDTQEEYLGKHLTQVLKNHRIVTNDCVWQFYKSYKNNSTEDIVAQMKPKSLSPQKAG